MDRKTGGRRGKNQTNDKRRRQDEQWHSKTTASGQDISRGGGRYDERDYDYQYIHKDRKQYSRDEMMQLVAKAKIDEDTLEDLVIKCDLLFSDDTRQPVGDSDDGKGERFVEGTNDEGKDKRDDNDYQD